MSVAVPTDAAADRPLALVMRGDLELRPQQFGGRRYWAVKDPVSLRYFHLREEEYTLLTLLDGRTSVDELRQKCDQLFAPRRLSREQVAGFLAMLHNSGLVLADAAGQGEQLLVRRRQQQRRQWFEALASVLAIRLPGVNPRRLLDAMTPWCSWLFSLPAVCLSLVMAAAAMLLVAVNFDTVQARLPALEAIVGASNLPWLALALAGIKILHELGHAVACRRFGGDCHEVGVMLLVFTPTLYCNVSDSWMIDSKWRRIAIAAAGIYVELILAAICTFLWWFSQPGLLNSLCLNVVIVCSIGTLLVNGNPLLRYDGYFILSDLVEVPNLRAQSAAAVRRLFAQVCLGVELPEDRLAPEGQPWFLVGYAVAAFVYRVIVVVLVLWVLNEVLKPYGLAPLVVLVAAVTVVGMVWPAIDRLTRWGGNPLRRRIAPLRAAATGAVLAGVVLAALLVPLPMRVSAPLVMEYRDAHRVYATVPGTLVWSADVGQQVRSGDVVAQLADADVERELVKRTSERDRQRLYVAHLAAARLQGVAGGTEVPGAKAALADLEEQLAQVTRDAQRLTLVAPADGVVLPPPNVPAVTSQSNVLPRWTGTPLDERNQSAYLQTGEMLCLVGDPSKFDAILHIDEHDVELVRAGQRVHVMPDHTPGQSYPGTLVEIARLDLEVMPRELTAAGDLPASTDPRGVARPLSTWYQARVRFDEEPPRMVARMHGRAKIEVAPRTLAARVARYLKQTFGG